LFVTSREPKKIGHPWNKQSAVFLKSPILQARNKRHFLTLYFSSCRDRLFWKIAFYVAQLFMLFVKVTKLLWTDFFLSESLFFGKLIFLTSVGCIDSYLRKRSNFRSLNYRNQTLITPWNIPEINYKSVLNDWKQLQSNLS